MEVVADGEDGGRNLAHIVAEHPAHVPLRLRDLAPRDAVEREPVARHLARRAVLALPHPRVRRVLRAEPLELLHVAVALLRRRHVAVVDEAPEELDVVPERLVARLVEFGSGRAERETRETRVGDVLPNDPGGADVERRDRLGLLHGRSVHGRNVRFVPHEPVAHASLEVLREGVHPAVPRGQRLLGSREAAGKIVPAAACVDRVAVIRFQHGVQPVRKCEVDALVKPREIVFALHLLALRPAALQADGTDAELRQVVLVGRELREVAVEQFAPDHPLVVFRVGRRARHKRPHHGHLQAGRSRRRHEPQHQDRCGQRLLQFHLHSPILHV